MGWERSTLRITGRDTAQTSVPPEDVAKMALRLMLLLYRSHGNC